VDSKIVSAPCWTRTNNLLIKSQSVSGENAGELDHFETRRATDVAVELETFPSPVAPDPELALVIATWPTLPEGARRKILKAVKMAGKKGAS
jgi:hypothetical protein